MAVDSLQRRRPRYQVEFVNDIEDVRREFYRIAEYLNQPLFDGVQFNIQGVLPERPRPGLVMYFAANVVSAVEGLHEFKTGGAWAKL